MTLGSYNSVHYTTLNLENFLRCKGSTNENNPNSLDIVLLKLWMLKHFENKEFELLNIFIEYLICNCVLHQIVTIGVNVAEVGNVGI